MLVALVVLAFFAPTTSQAQRCADATLSKTSCTFVAGSTYYVCFTPTPPSGCIPAPTQAIRVTNVVTRMTTIVTSVNGWCINLDAGSYVAAYTFNCINPFCEGVSNTIMFDVPFP